MCTQEIRERFETCLVDENSLEHSVLVLEAKWEGLKAFRSGEKRAVPVEFTAHAELSEAWMSGYDHERSDVQTTFNE